MSENKVKFGLKKCYYAVITDTAGVYTYGTPVAMPGAKTLSAARSGDSNTFEADDVDFWTTNSQQYDVSLEVAKLPESFFTDVLSFAEDGKNILWEDGSECKRIALMFEVSGNQNNPRYAFLNCLPQPPDVEAETSKAKDPKTVTLKLTASADPNGRTMAISKSDTDATAYGAWFTTVSAYTTGT